MRELVIVSGKGGTGKTSLTAAFATLAGHGVLCDADVDAADLHLLMQPQVRQRHDFIGGGKAVIDKERCTSCGLCRDLCRFAAITSDFRVESLHCEGCGVCVDLCPAAAIDFPLQICGQWFISDTRFGSMVHARLGIAQENSGKLVSLVRKEARRVAEEQGSDLILTDGPPGIGCPVIAALGGATALLLVVEPTVSGIHDMERVVDLAAHFRLPGMVCINKYDLNLDNTIAIEEMARRRKLAVVGRIPFDAAFVKAMVAGKTLVEFGERTALHTLLDEIWGNILAFPSMNTLGIADFTATIE